MRGGGQDVMMLTVRRTGNECQMLWAAIDPALFLNKENPTAHVSFEIEIELT